MGVFVFASFFSVSSTVFINGEVADVGGVGLPAFAISGQLSASSKLGGAGPVVEPSAFCLTGIFTVKGSSRSFDTPAAGGDTCAAFPLIPFSGGRDEDVEVVFAFLVGEGAGEVILVEDDVCVVAEIGAVFSVCVCVCVCVDEDNEGLGFEIDGWDTAARWAICSLRAAHTFGRGDFIAGLAGACVAVAVAVEVAVVCVCVDDCC